LNQGGKSLFYHFLTSRTLYNSYEFLYRVNLQELIVQLDNFIGYSSYDELSEFFREIKLINNATIEKTNTDFIIELCHLFNLYLSNFNFSKQSSELPELKTYINEPFLVGKDVLDSYERHLVYQYYVLQLEPSEISKLNMCSSNITHKLNLISRKVRGEKA
jgi:hypothetical protein